jgi:GTP-binding protein
MKIRSAQFEISAPALAACPKPTVPEFAFIGRSNVGKSSLLNLLTGKRDLAKVSSTPGHTKLINFFLINEAWRMIDLPGYGYAASTKRDPHRFQDLVAEFLAGRDALAEVFVLIDSRHSPQQIDLEFVTWLASVPRSFALVFTKIDKSKASVVRKNTDAFVQAISGIGNPAVFSTSTVNKAGTSEILRHIQERSASAPPLPSEETPEVRMASTSITSDALSDYLEDRDS